ncbi:MAG: hypothetical protein GX827_08545 [Clostridiales bacterium]|jgi:hypothetical protein|nr:hypothetical protein [Clostridiales bacterium]
MNIFRKIIAISLAAAISLPLISGCGDTGKSDAETTAAEIETTVEVTTDPNDRSGFKDNLPDDLDFGGMTIESFPRLHTAENSSRGRRNRPAKSLKMRYMSEMRRYPSGLMSI